MFKLIKSKIKIATGMDSESLEVKTQLPDDSWAQGRQHEARSRCVSSALTIIGTGRCLQQLGLMGCQTGPDQSGTSCMLPGSGPGQMEGAQAWGCWKDGIDTYLRRLYPVQPNEALWRSNRHPKWFLLFFFFPFVGNGHLNYWWEIKSKLIQLNFSDRQNYL